MNGGMHSYHPLQLSTMSVNAVQHQAIFRAANTAHKQTLTHMYDYPISSNTIYT